MQFISEFIALFVALAITSSNDGPLFFEEQKVL
jgi:hypothetical protein